MANTGGGSGSKKSKKTTEQPTPSESHKLMETGQKQIESKDWTLALATLKKVTELDAKNADAFNYLAYATRKSGKPA